MIIKDEFVIALPVDHPLAVQPSISVYDLENVEYILSGEKFCYEIGAKAHFISASSKLFLAFVKEQEF